MQDAIIIRHSAPADSEAIHRLANLDNRAAPRGDSLLAFVDGELAVARASNGHSVADPFRPASGAGRAARDPGDPGEGGMSTAINWQVASARASQARRATARPQRHRRRWRR